VDNLEKEEVQKDGCDEFASTTICTVSPTHSSLHPCCNQTNILAVIIDSFCLCYIFLNNHCNNKTLSTCKVIH